MPIYEYKCESCGHAFSLMQRMGAGTEGLACPECKGTELKKLMSQTVFGVWEAKINAPFEWTPPKAPKGTGSCGSGMCGSGMCGV